MKKGLFIFWIILVVIVEFKFEQAPKLNSSQEGFSIENVSAHLDSITFAPHLIGSQENKLVRDYLIKTFEEMGIEVELYIDDAKSYGNKVYRRYGRTENIIARLKGSKEGKALLIAAHYDSVLRAPGAADDCHAVACMVEVARLMKDTPIENDIIFLITDGEEMGLLGANAYTENRNLDEIGLMLNYEARGNAGPSIAFEWSDGNYDLVKQYKKVTNQPFTNALSYEIYKRLPNNTDYTFFKEKGVLGINHAFIDGFSYYHNPVDDFENINWESVYHTGDNMYRLTRHFANTPLVEIDTSQNGSFFNLMGQMIIYPAKWNTVLIIITLLWVCISTFRSIKKKNSIDLLGVIKALPMTLVIIIINLALAYGITQVIYKIYPQYEMFYSGQFYNHKFYLLLLIGLAIIVQSIAFKYMSEKLKENIVPATLILLALLSVGIYLEVSTATYAMIFPLMSLLAMFEINNNMESSLVKTLGIFILSIIPLSIFTTLIHSVFLAFSLDLLIAPMFILSLFFLSTHIIFPSSWKSSKNWTILGIGISLMALIGGQFTSAPTTDKPLPLSMNYLYDADKDQAAYISSDIHLTDQTVDYFQNRIEESDESKPDFLVKNLYRYNMAALTDKKPHFNFPTYQQDSINPKGFTAQFDNSSFNTILVIEENSNVQSLIANGYEFAINEDIRYLDLYGYTRDSLQVVLNPIDTNQNTYIKVVNKYLNLDEPQLDDEYRWVDGYSGIIQKLEYATPN